LIDLAKTAKNRRKSITVAPKDNTHGCRLVF